MRVSGSREALAQSNGQKAPERGRAAEALAPTSSEAVDEEIQSLLTSLEEPAAGPGPAVPETPTARSQARREHRRARRQRPRLRLAERIDLFLVLAVVLGLAIGLLIAFLANG